MLNEADMLRECMMVDWLDVLGLLQITTTISAVTPQWSPPSPRCYRNSHPQYRGITANFTSVTADFPRLPRYYRCPHTMQLSNVMQRTVLLSEFCLSVCLSVHQMRVL